MDSQADQQGVCVLGTGGVVCVCGGGGGDGWGRRVGEGGGWEASKDGKELGE